MKTKTNVRGGVVSPCPPAPEGWELTAGQGVDGQTSCTYEKKKQ